MPICQLKLKQFLIQLQAAPGENVQDSGLKSSLLHKKLTFGIFYRNGGVDFKKFTKLCNLSLDTGRSASGDQQLNLRA
jgi:hypothetical protein